MAERLENRKETGDKGMTVQIKDTFYPQFSEKSFSDLNGF